MKPLFMKDTSVFVILLSRQGFEFTLGRGSHASVNDHVMTNRNYTNFEQEKT